MLSAFDLFLLPSLFEGVPLTLVEAQTNGMPIIASTNVPAEIGFSDLVHFVPLLDNKWVDSICEMTTKEFQPRNSYINIVKNNNYDIEIEACRIRKILTSGELKL